MSRAAPVTAAGAGAVSVLLGQIAEDAHEDVQVVWWVLACAAGGVSLFAAGIWVGIDRLVRRDETEGGRSDGDE